MYDTYIRERYNNKLTETQFKLFNYIINSYPETILIVDGKENEPMFDLLAFLAMYTGYYKDMIDSVSLTFRELLNKINVIIDIENKNASKNKSNLKILDNLKRLVIKKALDNDFENLIDLSIGEENIFNYIKDNSILFESQAFRKHNKGTILSIRRLVTDYLATKMQLTGVQVEVDISDMTNIEIHLKRDENTYLEIYNGAYVDIGAPQGNNLFYLHKDFELVKILNEHYARAGTTISIIVKYNHTDLLITNLPIEGNRAYDSVLGDYKSTTFTTKDRVYIAPGVVLRKTTSQNYTTSLQYLVDKTVEIGVSNPNTVECNVDIELKWYQSGTLKKQFTLSNIYLGAAGYNDSTKYINYITHPHIVTNYGMGNADATLSVKVTLVQDRDKITTDSVDEVQPNNTLSPTISNIIFRAGTLNSVTPHNIDFTVNKAAGTEGYAQEVLVYTDEFNSYNYTNAFTNSTTAYQDIPYYSNSRTLTKTFNVASHIIKFKALARYSQYSNPSEYSSVKTVGIKWSYLGTASPGDVTFEKTLEQGEQLTYRPREAGLYIRRKTTYNAGGWSVIQFAPGEIDACGTTPPTEPGTNGQTCVGTDGKFYRYDAPGQQYEYFESITVIE